MTKYRCGRCNYKFEHKNENASINCPYCGKKDKLIIEEKVVDIISDPELDSYDW